MVLWFSCMKETLHAEHTRTHPVAILQYRVLHWGIFRKKLPSELELLSTFSPHIASRCCRYLIDCEQRIRGIR